jgi:hypothetical protein
MIFGGISIYMIERLLRENFEVEEETEWKLNKNNLIN